MLERLRVDYVLREAALGHVNDAAAGAAAVAEEAFVGPADGVRGEDYVVQLQQRVGGIYRFLLENVQARSGDGSSDERLGQGRLVDDRPSRHVDEVGGRLHQRQAAGVQEMVCF